jgi:pentatricopeptide repeat protein
MVQRGCERNVITYSSLIAACEKAGRWQMALDLLEEMHRDGCKPNVVTFNSVIAACGSGALLNRIFLTTVAWVANRPLHANICPCQSIHHCTSGI